MTITFADGVLSEDHVDAEKDEPAESPKYTIEGGELVLHMEAGGVSCKRFFKRQ